MKPSKPRRRLRLALWIAATTLALLALLAGLGAWSLEWTCIAQPPAMALPPVTALPVQEQGGLRRIGDSWLVRRAGILRMNLTGDPFTLGYSNGALSAQFIREQEDQLLDMVRQHVPSRFNLWLLRKYVLLRNKRLPEFVKEAHRQEIYGLSLATPDGHPEIGPPYHRFLNYHAAHDISHAVMDHPLVGCTSFAAWGAHTADGHLLLGRNFDFDAGRSFDTNKIVMQVKPDRGLRFLSVSWPGMIGVVSGMNEARIAVTINAANSVDVRQVGTPVSLVIRDVLQNASTLDAAIAIIRESTVFVSDLYLVADGKSGEAVVVEKTPTRCAVRRAEGERIICSNHFLTPELAGDPANLRYMADGTSVVRYQAMEALVAAQKGSLTPSVAVDILRNRDVPRVADPGLGNAAAINAAIGTHSVVLDVTDGVLWVSAGPHQFGAFHPFTLKAFDAPAGLDPIPADPLLDTPAYRRYRQSLDAQARAETLLKKGKLVEAAALADEAATLNPGSYSPPLLRGRIAVAQKDWPAARRALQDSLSLSPAYGTERALIGRLLAECDAAESSRK